MSTSDPSSRRILGLAIPMAGEQFLVFGVALFDTALAGQLSVDALSAQAVVVRWVQFTSVIFNITVIGGSILVAQAKGKRDHSGANEVVRGSLGLAFAAGLLVTLVALLASPLFIQVMGVEPNVSALGVMYLRLISLSFPLTFVLLSAGGCIRGAGDARTPLLVMTATNVVHMILATTLALGLGGFIRLGLDGIALATVVSRGLGMAVMLALLVRGVAGLRLGRPWPRLEAMGQVWDVGKAVGGEQLALRLGQLVNLRLVTSLGTTALAAYVVALNSLAIILMIGLGFMAATLTLVGQQVGAGDGERVRHTGWQALYLAWLVMGGLSLLFFLWPGVNSLFSSDAAVLALAAAGLRAILFGVPFEAVNQVLTGGIRGAGDTRYPMWITTLGHWLVRLPLIVLFIGPLGLGLNGVWAAMIIEMLVRAALNSRYFRSGFWLPAAKPEASQA